MQQITLKLTIDETNLILEALGQMPFAKVYALVANLEDQARRQLNGQAEEGDTGGAAAAAVGEASDAG